MGGVSMGRQVKFISAQYAGTKKRTRPSRPLRQHPDLLPPQPAHEHHAVSNHSAGSKTTYHATHAGRMRAVQKQKLNYLAKFAVEFRILGKIRVQLAILPVEDFRDGQKLEKSVPPSVFARGLS